MNDPTSSDALSTGTILNVMALLGYVTKQKVPKSGKTYFIRYSATQKINNVGA